MDATDRKGLRLKEANEGQSFHRNLEDVDLWLSECEAQLANEDLGKDLTSVQNLQKKLKDLESDILARKERIEAIQQAAQNFEHAGHFDAANIMRKENALVAKFNNLFEPIHSRKLKLAESLQLQQLLRDIEDEETWIREKEPAIGLGSSSGGAGGLFVFYLSIFFLLFIRNYLKRVPKRQNFFCDFFYKFSKN